MGRDINNMSAKTYMKDESKIYIIVSLVSLILLFYSIWEIKPVIVDITDSIGLVTHLTLAYWAGFILIILFSIRLCKDEKNCVDKSGYIYLIYLLVIGLYLFAVPVFAEENARFPWSYFPSGEVKNVLDAKKIDIGSKYPVLSYRSWPATHFISAYILYSTGIKMEDVVKYMPLFWLILTILILFSTGRKLGLTNDRTFLMSTMVISSFWSFHYYYGPQSVAYLLYIMVFAMTISFSRYMSDAKGTIVALMSFVILIITHMLSSIALMLSFFAISKFFRKNRKKILIFILVIFTTWYVYVAPTMLNIGVKEFVKQASDIDTFSAVKTVKYKSGDLLTRQIAHYARLSYLGAYFILMTSAIVLYLRGRIKDKSTFEVCLLSILSVASLYLFKYGAGAEMEDRIYILSLMPMALIMVYTFNRKILILATLLLIFLHLPAHYGSESQDQTLTTELKGSEFFAETIRVRAHYSYYYSTYIIFYDPQKILMGWASFSGIGQVNLSRLDRDRVKYIVDSKGTYNFMMYAYGYDPIKKWLSTKPDDELIKFYDNGYYKIFKKYK